MNINRLNAPTWYSRFRAEMKAIGCVFEPNPSIFGDEEIKVPRDKMREAKAIIDHYMQR